MSNFINLTPHDIVLNDGKVYPPSGIVARVSSKFEEVVNLNCEWCGLPETDDGRCPVCGQVEMVAVPKFPREFILVLGEVENLPEITGDTYIVSAMVLAAVTVTGRKDLVAPATGHPEAVRNDKGQIVSVPGFIRS